MTLLRSRSTSRSALGLKGSNCHMCCQHINHSGSVWTFVGPCPFFTSVNFGSSPWVLIQLRPVSHSSLRAVLRHGREITLESLEWQHVIEGSTAVDIAFLNTLVFTDKWVNSLSRLAMEFMLLLCSFFRFDSLDEYPIGLHTFTS